MTRDKGPALALAFGLGCGMVGWASGHAVGSHASIRAANANTELVATLGKCTAQLKEDASTMQAANHALDTATSDVRRCSAALWRRGGTFP